MPYIQQPSKAGPIHGTHQYRQSSHSSSFAEVNVSSVHAGAPLEAFGDIPARQEQCIVGHTSGSIDTLARARILAVMAMNIFVYDKPLNAHRDRWICPFSNCKQSFLDPKAMMSHAAHCTHISASAAYCNCCGCYYDFPGQGQAFLTRAGDTAPPVAKDSAITKGKRKIHEFLSRHSGSASSSKVSSSFSTEFGLDPLLASRKGSVVSDFSIMGLSSVGQSREGPAELGADYQIVEIGNSSIPPSRSDLSRSTVTHIPQRLTELTVSTMSTTGYIEPMVSDYGDFCMSPTECSLTDDYYTITQQPSNEGGSYTTGGGPLQVAQQSEDADRALSWDTDVGHSAIEGLIFCQSPIPSQESQGLMADMPNFSRPLLLPLQSRPDGEVSLSGSQHLHQLEYAIPAAMTNSQHQDGDIFSLPDLSPGQQSHFDVGIVDSNVQPFQITKGHLQTSLPSARTSPRFPISYRGDDEELSCSACDYRPRGAKAYRKANLNKHWKNKHEESIPWICPECGIPCKRKDNLQVHQDTVCRKTNPRRPPGHRRKHVVRSRQARRVPGTIP